MSIENQVITASFDNSKFERNIKTTIGSLNRFKSTISQMVGSNKTFQELGKTVDSVKVKFSSLQVVAVSALENIANSAINTGKQLLKSLSVDQLSAGFEQYANIISSTQTIMTANADKSLEEINSQLDRMRWFTDETSFNLQSMVNMLGQFTASGRAFETSVTTMLGFSVAAGEAGANAQVASEALVQASQTLGKGLFQYKDWQEAFSNRAIDTPKLRQAFLDAAVAVGTLKKNADDSYTSIVKGAKKTKITIDDMNSSKSLNDARWLTTEVFETAMASYGKVADDLFDLYNYIVEGGDFAGNDTFTKELADSYIELAKAEGIEINTTSDLIDLVERASTATEELKEQNSELLAGLNAFKNVQVAKTWKEVVEATQTAVSTKWANIYEVVFGDIEEAKKNFTDLSNELWDVFAGPIDELGGFFKDWKNNGGYDLLWSQEEDNLGAVWNIVEALKSYVQVIEVAIEKIFGKVDGDKLISWTEKFQSFTKSLILDEKGINKWANTIKTVYSAFKNYYGFIKEVVNTISIAINGGGTSVRGVINTVAGTLSKAFGTGRKILSAFNKAFSAVMKQVKGAFKDAFGSGGGLLKTLVDIARDFFGSIAKNKDLLSNIRTTLRGFFELVMRLKDLFVRIGETVADVFGWEKKEGNGLVNFIAKILEFTAKIFGNVKNNDKLDKFEDGFVNFIKTAAEILKSIWELLKEIGKAGKNLFTQIFGKDSDKTMGESIGEFIHKTVDAIKTFVHDVANNEGFINFLKTVKDVGGKVIEFVKELWNVLFEGRSVGEVLGDAFGWVGNIFGGLFGSGDMEAAGENTVKGFAQGLGNGIKWVINAAKEIANTVIFWIRDLLGIHSPALVPMEMGENTGKGFGLGILDSIKFVIEKIKDFIHRVIEGFKDETNDEFNLNNFVEGDLAGNLGKGLKSLYNFFKSLAGFSLDVITRGLTFLMDVHTAIFNFLIEHDMARRIVLIAAAISALLIALAVIYKKIKREIEWNIGYIDIVHNFSYLIESVGDYFWEMSKKQEAQRFRVIAESIKQLSYALLLTIASFGLMAKTIADLWKENKPAIFISLGVLVALVGVIALLVLQLNKTNRATSKLEKVGTGIFGKTTNLKTSSKGVSASVSYIGAFILEFAAAILIIGKVIKDLVDAVAALPYDPDHPDEFIGKAILGVGSLVAVMGILMAMTLILNKQITKTDKSKVTKEKYIKLAAKIATIGLIMALVAKAMRSVAKSLVMVLKVGATGEQMGAAALSLTAMFAAVMAIVMLLNKFSGEINTTKVLSLAPLLVAISTLMGVLGVTLTTVTGVTALVGDNGALWSSVGAISVMLASMMGALMALGTFQPGKIIAAAAALSMLGAAISAVAIGLSGLMLMMTLVNPEKLNPHGALWSIVGALTVMMSLFTGILAIFGKNEGIAGKAVAVGGAFALIGVGALAAASAVLVLGLAFDKIMTAIVKFRNMSQDTIKGFFDNLGVAFEAAIVNFFNVVFKYRELFLQWLVNTIVMFADAIRLSSPALEDSLIAVIHGLIRIGYKTLPEFNVMLVEMLVDLLKTLLKYLPKLLQLGVEIGVVAFEALLELLTRTNLILVKSIINFIIEAIPILMEGLGDAIEAFVSAIPGLLYKLAAAIYNHGSKIFEAAKTVGEALTYTLMYGIGSAFNIGSLIKSFFGGLVSGFKGEEKEAAKGGGGVFEATKEGYEKAAQINSPSKVMMKLGEYTVDGLVKGIDKNQNGVKDSAIGMGKNIDESFRNYMGIHSASVRMYEDGVWTVKGTAKGVRDHAANQELAESTEVMATVVPKTYHDVIERDRAQMVEDTIKAAEAAKTEFYKVWGQYAWDVYNDPTGLNNTVLQDFINQSQKETESVKMSDVSPESEIAKLRKQLNEKLELLYSNKYLTAGLFENGYVKKFDSEKDMLYLSEQQITNFINKIDGYMKSVGNGDVAASARQVRFKDIDEAMAAAADAGRTNMANYGKKEEENLTPVERIWKLLNETIGDTKSLFSEMAHDLGLDTIGDKIKGALGIGSGESFFDSLKSKVLGITDGSFMDNLLGENGLGSIIPSADDWKIEIPEVTGASVEDVMNGSGVSGGSYDVAYATSGYAGDATASSKGAWGKVPVSTNTDNSTNTNNFYVYAEDPQTAANTISRTLQRQMERRASEWH